MDSSVGEFPEVFKGRFSDIYSSLMDFGSVLVVSEGLREFRRV